jgi:hypothetical protein
MPWPALVGTLLRWILGALFGAAVMRRILPAEWLAFLQSPEGQQQTVELIIGVAGLLWGFYVQLSHNTGLHVADNQAAGTGVEEIKRLTSEIGPIDKIKVGSGNKDVAEVIPAPAEGKES